MRTGIPLPIGAEQASFASTLHDVPPPPPLSRHRDPEPVTQKLDGIDARKAEEDEWEAYGWTPPGERFRWLKSIFQSIWPKDDEREDELALEEQE